MPSGVKATIASSEELTMEARSAVRSTAVSVARFGIVSSNLLFENQGGLHPPGVNRCGAGERQGVWFPVFRPACAGRFVFLVVLRPIDWNSKAKLDAPGGPDLEIRAQLLG